MVKNMLQIGTLTWMKQAGTRKKYISGKIIRTIQTERQNRYIKVKANG